MPTSRAGFARYSDSYATYYRLRRFASPTTPITASLITAVAWITSIGIVALVPIDVWSTLKATSRSSVAVMWEIAYW